MNVSSFVHRPRHIRPSGETAIAGEQLVAAQARASWQCTELSTDLLCLKTPQHLRETLQGVDRLQCDYGRERVMICAVACAAFSSLMPLPLTVVSAVGACGRFSDPPPTGSCASSVASAIGCLVGLAGIAFTALNIAMGATHFDANIAQIDRQLYYRHRARAAQSRLQGPQVHQPSADHLASRYIALTYPERQLICSVLLDDYLATTTGNNPHLAVVGAQH